MKTILQTPTNNLKKSLDFYSKLRFKVISEKDPVIVSDGKIFIEINADRYARAGLKLFSSTWEAVVNQLKKITTVIEVENGYLLSDPSGTWIYLMETPEILPDTVATAAASVLGNFAGISLETIDIEQSMEIWKLLGFVKSGGDPASGWVSLVNDEHLTISIMKPNSCPHLFFNPSLTYFNGKNNEQVIENIRSLNIPITEEITHFNKEGRVDNIVVRDPGGLGAFIFSD